MSMMFMFAKRFVSGERREQALQVVERLNAGQLDVTVDFLGEDVLNEAETRQNTSEYLHLLDDMQTSGARGHVSLKLSMLGARLSNSLCLENLSRICKHADGLGRRVAIDMEGSSTTELTLGMYERVAREFNSPEIVLQAYLKRTPEDVERVLRANGRLRLCKGAYKEPPEVALQSMSDIVSRYQELVAQLLMRGQHVAIASHDSRVIDFCRDMIAREKIPADRYEFQMLYGMRENTARKLRSEGHPMCIYVPYGKHWLPYFRRRLTERKENVFFVLTNLLRE